LKKPDRTWTARLIEEAFLRRMFGVLDVQEIRRETESETKRVKTNLRPEASD
jgi:hypothetical protein